MSWKSFKGANVFMSRNLVPPELFDSLHDALKQNGAEVFLCCDPSRTAQNDYHIISSSDHVMTTHSIAVPFPTNLTFICVSDLSLISRRNMMISEPRDAICLVQFYLNYLCFSIPFLLIRKVIIPFLIFCYWNCLLLGGHQKVALMRCYHCFYSMLLGLFRFAFSTVSSTYLLSIFCCLYRKRVLFVLPLLTHFLWIFGFKLHHREIH